MIILLNSRLCTILNTILYYHENGGSVVRIYNYNGFDKPREDSCIII